jgi:hypothetical protein
VLDIIVAPINFCVLYLEGEIPYFWVNAEEKYSRLLKPEEKQTCVTGRVLFCNRTSAFFNLRFIKKLAGE